MNGLQPFFYNLISHAQLFVIILGACLLFYTILFKKYVFSLFDPMVFDLFYSCIGFSEVIFLFWLDEISTYWLMSYLLTQFAFFAGIIAFGRIKTTTQIQATQPSKALTLSLNRPLIQILLTVCFVLLVQSVISEWMKTGIPMFQATSSIENRPITGMNFSERISYVTSPVCIILSTLYLAIGTKKMRYVGGLIFVFATLNIASSGAKQGIISIVFYIGFVIIYLKANGFNEYRFMVKSRNVLFVVAVFVTLLIIRLKYSDQLIQSVYYLQFRILLSGDGYIMGYPNGVIGNLPEYNWIFGLFSGPLRQLHLVSPSDLPPAIGYELYWYHNPYSNLLLGPNSRHNILGARYLSLFGSILYSGILGIIYGKIRSGLNHCKGLPPLFFVFFCLYCIRISQIEADPLLFQSYALNVTLVFSIVYAFSYIVKESGTRPFPFIAKANSNERETIA